MRRRGLRHDATTQAEPSAAPEAADYFLLRPAVDKAYGYAHAVKIGDDIKISVAVSMDDEGNPTAVGDLEQQMKNAYSDMAGFLAVAAYRNSFYTKHFPTGTWLEVKGLALPEFMIEVELEAHRAR